MKSIVKEIFIILLLCIAVCLVFGVIFYDYIPNNKVVPSTVEAYKTSNTIKDEISQEIVDYPKYNTWNNRFRLNNKKTRQKLWIWESKPIFKHYKFCIG